MGNRSTAASCAPKDYAQYRPIGDVRRGFPPAFIYHTTADKLVSADGIVRFCQELVAADVPVAMHIFANGQHGTGLGGADPALSL
ncbi:prolyl oligopeptidase family serine peptidase [uncultured Novosphingobium sp.]|uniref:prolyl oligopeptidase family serine peptidase n=1 Tax=uncultured Novosphingobium sp. TaxID=292277 RepID=UPI00338EEEA5